MGSIGVRRDALNGTPNDEPQEAEDAGNGNSRLTVPVIRLPGRGLNIVLDLIYNSNLWHKNTNSIIFDIDHDWPAPGWSLGFGKLIRTSWSAAAMLIDADGTRHPFMGTSTTYSSGFWTFDGHTTDGTFIDYSVVIPNQRRGIMSAKVKYANGTIAEFNAKSLNDDYGTVYPTRIIDANGNFITIAYKNNTGPEIDTITDTLGRILSFHYDTNNLLTAITGPGLNGGRRTLIRLHYKRLTLLPSFDRNLNTICRQNAPYIIDAIYYPSTATGFWFGDSDSFSNYGMMVKSSERRGMGFYAASVNEQGIVSSGVMTREHHYEYLINQRIPLREAPKCKRITQTWEGMDVPPSVTQYLILLEANPRRVEITYPNGTRSVHSSYNKQPNDADFWMDGLVFLTEKYDASNNILHKSTFIWEQGDYHSPRLKRRENTDELNQKSAIEFDYGVYNRETEVREYDYGGITVLRRVHTDYIINNPYVDRHIFNLPRMVQVFEGNETNPVSRIEYTYDNSQLVNTPGVIGHLDEWNPYAPNTWVPPHTEKDCDYGRKPPCVNRKINGYHIPVYNPSTFFRGNITSVKTYADASRLSGAINKTYSYDITGNLIKVSTSLCEKNYGYTLATQYAYPTIFTRGATDPASVERLVIVKNYDINTALLLSSTDENGRMIQTRYSPSTLRPEMVQSPTMASISYAYNEIAMTITETTRDSSGKIEAQNIKHYNGLGKVCRTESVIEGPPQFSFGTWLPWNIIDIQYDALGRTWKHTQPYRRGQTRQWNELFYDGFGRVTLIRAPDGSQARNYYNEVVRPNGASGSPGQTLRNVDAWARERWTRVDALGNLVEIIEPNPNGRGSVFEPGSLGTTYFYYYALNRLARIIQGSQSREFGYDSLGRLTHQFLPEKLATLDDAGLYKGPGSKWSDVFRYDERSNLRSHTDARGIKTNYIYDEDPLNRLQAVYYNTTGFGDTNNPILPASPVIFEYMKTGDLTRPFRATAGECVEEYGYDVEGRLNSKITIPTQRGHPMAIDYIYDSLSRIKEIRYPAAYGIPGNPRKLVQYDYGIGGQLSRLKVDGVEHASEIVYNEASQMTSLRVGVLDPNQYVGVPGPNQLTEEYEFDPVHGFLNRQRVIREGILLLDISYDYLKGNGRTGQVTAIINNLNQEEKRSYLYDTLRRLVKVTFGNPTRWNPYNYWTQEFGYDSYGNRTLAKAFGPHQRGDYSSRVHGPELPNKRDGIDGIIYDTKTNRITTGGFSYDASGNLTRDGTKKRYYYDAAGRLIKTSGNRKGVVEVNIFGVGRQRLIREFGIEDLSGNIKNFYSKTCYAWSGDAVIAEYAGPAGSLKKSYFYLGNRLYATFSKNGSTEMVQYYHPDRLGTRLITDEEGTIIKEQVTFSFGTVPDTVSTSDNRLFTSYDRSSETGLDYAVNRYYESNQGRFTQVDRLGIGAVSLVNPQSLNMYTYVQNDPVNAIDPNGLRMKSDIDCNIEGGSIVCRVAGGGNVVGRFPYEEIVVTGIDPGPLTPPDVSWIHNDPDKRANEGARGAGREKGRGIGGGGSSDHSKGILESFRKHFFPRCDETVPPTCGMVCNYDKRPYGTMITCDDYGKGRRVSGFEDNEGRKWVLSNYPVRGPGLPVKPTEPDIIIEVSEPIIRPLSKSRHFSDL
jgi:RHS repeat-associated protein